ncbi:PEP-CTERM system histidine kinase PrsK [Massilia forsythiae]|uniref:histidine kinase n=1 Tax=Massilia forsythiae TaxID=2728020 RepID=A0A7Z2ZS77_9BURK|nr:XrtA/PEP-CTERM system histidine kinase PrsK [Massilia forsythiae]QJD99904.1 PEP-CTERM system histidine kinase PrsK [Massilia forsythiae]
MINIAATSYALAAAGFLALGLPVLSGWRGRAQRVPLSLACLTSAAWAAALAWEASSHVLLTPLAGLFEVARDGAWSLFLVALLGHWQGENGRPRRSLVAAASAYACLMGVMLACHLAGMPSAFASLSILFAFVGMPVYGMLLVEQVYRNKTIEERWAIKFACLGVGAIFAYDFYMYSNTMLFRELNPDLWIARGVVNAVTVPLLGASLARRGAWSTSFSVSRRVVFHSAALFGSAVYLLAMGSVGYYLRYVGGRWGTVLQTAFLFGAVCLLGVILFSGTARSWLKVTISKHFYRYNYDYREEWMRFTRTLSERGPGLGERTIQALAVLVESPGGVLWQRSEGGKFESHARWQAPGAGAAEPQRSPFCQFLESTQWVVDLDEYVASPDKYEGLAVPDWLLDYPRRWLVVPLMLHEKLFGFVVLQRPRSPLKLNWEVYDLLEIAGSQAASYLAQEDAANALMVARQFESFNRMSTFVVHDLKNLVAQLSLMNANAEKHKDNPEFQKDMLETLNHSVQKMKLLLQKLSRTENAANPLPLAIDQVVRQAMALKSAFEPHPQLLVEESGLTVVADRERLERVVGHLIQNAIEATPRDGHVMIRVGRRAGAALEDDAVEIEITDTGEGMTEEFIRERLFKPFDSTKSAGMGIGVFESREYITELGGMLEVASRPALGTTFKVVLPPHREAAVAAT